MDDVTAVFRYYADIAVAQEGRTIDVGQPNVLSRIAHEPVGVCALITPWNYPLLQLSWKLAPALVAGCTCVIKPSEVTPLTSVLLVRLVEEAGVPPGVVNILLGTGPAVGAPLTAHPDVDMVSFTGGLATGQAIIRASARDREAGRGGAGRQESQHRICRRRFRDRRRQRPHRRLPALRPGAARRARG